MEFRELETKRYRCGNKKEHLYSVVGHKGLRLRQKWHPNGMPWYKGFEQKRMGRRVHVGRNYSQNDKGEFTSCVSFGGDGYPFGVVKRYGKISYFSKEKEVTKDLLTLVKDPQNLEPHEEGLVKLKYGFKRENLEVLSCIGDVLKEVVCD